MLQFIIPAYGESPFLEMCIQSLKNQTTDVDIILTTSTPCIFIERLAEKYKIPVIVNSQGGSIAADWNFALSNASKSYVSLAHQDDLYHKNFAKDVIAFFSKYPDAAILFTDSSEMIQNKIRIFTKREIVKLAIRNSAFLFSEVIFKRSQYFRLLAFGCSIPCASVVYNRALIQNLSFSNEFSVNLDWSFWNQLFKAGKKIGYLRGFYLTHRIHNRAETQIAKMDSRRHDEDAILFSYFWPQYIVRIIKKIYQLSY